MGLHIFGILGKNILASREFGCEKKYRTVYTTNMRVTYVFYIHFDKCVNHF